MKNNLYFTFGSFDDIQWHLYLYTIKSGMLLNLVRLEIKDKPKVEKIIEQLRERTNIEW